MGYLCHNIQIIKYVFFAVSKSTAYAIVHPKYHSSEGERVYRAQAILKLTFDLIFYSCTTFAAFFLFKDKYWFPKQLGGAGSADEIFREYPDYPSDSDPFILETYYMVQLGVYAFKIIESFAIRRKTYRKVYEFLLHHFIAETLIVFSVMSNLLPVGIVILFLHDCCDMTADMVRIYVETKFRKTSISVLLFILGAGNWFYMRLVVFPLYPLKALYDNIPGPENICYKIWFEHIFLVILSCILIVMHVYWWIYIMKGGLSMIFGKGITNPHDKGTSKVKET